MIIASGSASGAILGGFAIGVITTWTGIRTWRGRDARRVREALESGRPTGFGSAREYGTFFGAGAWGLLGGPGFLLGASGVVVQAALGRPNDWWFVQVVVCLSAALVLLGFLYAFVYLWFGMPDALRPPAQRGQPWPGRRRRRRRRRLDDMDDW